MYTKNGCLLMPGSSASLLPFNNNLNVLRNGGDDLLTICGTVVHKATVNTITWTTGSKSNSTGHDLHKRTQLHCNGNKAFILQAMLMRSKDGNSATCLIVCTTTAIQVYDFDGHELCKWHPQSDNDDSKGFSSLRVLTLLRNNYLAVGMQNGDINLLSMDSGFTTLTLRDGIKSDDANGVSALAVDNRQDTDQLAIGGENGCVRIYDQLDSSPHKYIHKFHGYGFQCCGIVFSKNDLLIAAYGSGHLRLFDLNTGCLSAEITAHAGWITGLDGARNAGLVLSVSEDSFVRVWQLSRDQESPVELKFSESVPDVRLCGGRFLQSDGRKFALTGYEQEEIMCYSV